MAQRGRNYRGERGRKGGCGWTFKSYDCVGREVKLIGFFLFFLFYFFALFGGFVVGAGCLVGSFFFFFFGFYASADSWQMGTLRNLWKGNFFCMLTIQVLVWTFSFFFFLFFFL